MVYRESKMIDFFPFKILHILPYSDAIALFSNRLPNFEILKKK